MRIDEEPMPKTELKNLYELLNLVNIMGGNVKKTYDIHSEVFKKVEKKEEPGPTLNVVTLRLTEKELHTLKWLLQRALTQASEGASDPSVAPLIRTLLYGLAD